MIEVDPLYGLEEPRPKQDGIIGTGIRGHIAIGGEGFFILRSPHGDKYCLSREGRFRFDQDLYLVNHRNYRVQGIFASDASMTTEAVDIRLPDSLDELKYWIGPDGVMAYFPSEGIFKKTAQIALAKIPFPEFKCRGVDSRRCLIQSQFGGREGFTVSVRSVQKTTKHSGS